MVIFLFIGVKVEVFGFIGVCVFVWMIMFWILLINFVFVVGLEIEYVVLLVGFVGVLDVY